jgi:radical SAM superfamily enzyme YgiQ (UPF0313 family)
MTQSKTLLVTPPFVQVNTPYPGTTFLTGYLREKGYVVDQRDLGLEVALRLFSRTGLMQVIEELKKKKSIDAFAEFFLENASDYLGTVEPTIRFLQGSDATLGHRIASRTFLPEGPRFQALDPAELEWAFGRLGVQDQAKHVASLYIDDLVDLVSKNLDPRFGLSKYGESLAASNPTFDALEEALRAPYSIIDSWIEERVHELYSELKFSVFGLSAPFPGCVFGGLRAAQVVRRLNPQVKIVLGGGYVNTELRGLTDSRIFEWVDAIVFDDGERPLECVLEWVEGKRSQQDLFRAKLLIDGVVTDVSSPKEHDVPQSQTGFPTTDGLRMKQYLSLVEILNPMHRFWSDLQWNKIMLAHGCYWKKCSFCDVTLDYIGRYDPSPMALTVERMKRLSSENGISGFHFVDEAAPPKALKELSEQLKLQGLSFTWWGNVRFDKVFTAELTELMSDAGCVAVSGGLEVASDRLLKKMNKGVTIDQVARVTKNFRNARILVHAYLMYGFPTQTEQETIDSLEYVRQLFVEGCLSSAFWHRFSATEHSPVGKDPKSFGIKITESPHYAFSRNDLAFEDPTGVDHGLLGVGLRKAVYNYMHGIGLEEDVREWFSETVPKTRVKKGAIARAIQEG